MPEATSTPATIATERPLLSPHLERALERLPFRTQLSFEPLFRQLGALAAADEASPRCEQARGLITALERVDDLRGAITSRDVVERHRDGIRLLMSFVFPELAQDEDPARAYAPFSPEAFFSTRAFSAVFEAEDVEVSLDNGFGEDDYYRENLLFAYRMLLHLHHGVEQSNYGIVKRVRDGRTGLDRYFMLDYSFRYVEAVYPGLEIPPQQDFSRLIDTEDLDELARRIPLEGVTFSGFNSTRYVEVTALQNVSLLKSELVEPDALNEGARFERIVQRLRSILQVPDLNAGLALQYSTQREHHHCTMRSVLKGFECCENGLDGSIYGQVFSDRKPLFVPDLEECDCDSAVVTHLKGRGLRSVGLVPLLDDGEVIGVLELASSTPDVVSAAATKRLADILPSLTIAARREMDEVESRMERTIKAHCTAIHPSVEWRFEDAAYRYNQELAATGQAIFEEIEFENVHPLYGSLDIRGSSDSRTRAIQADLLEQVDLARSTLARVHERHDMPIADYIDSVLEGFRASIAEGLSSGAELSVLEFLHMRVEPFFEYVRDHMGAEGEGSPVAAYYAALDPDTGILYRRRKDYEESVALINDTLAAYVDEQDQKAQAVFPHYFEKFKTDGVEHNIYVGQSMTRGRTFNEVQLRNLRLWQLRLTCEEARLAESLLPRMKEPLRTTPLVLVQSSPLTIKFSSEAKQFEVEGSYNVRYEIIKKRIDKSTIRGTGERLTQPGLLSVIYSQEKEGEEYLRYFEYLAERGYLEGDVERLALDDLPGVNGLHALRAPIRMS